MSLLKKKYKIILPISILSALFLLLGCEDKKDLEDKVYKQYNYINHLKKQNSVLKDSLAELNISLKENIDYSNKLKKGIVGKSPNDTKYILTLRCKQTSITFDVTDMVKDKLNVFEFDIMVDNDFIIK